MEKLFFIGLRKNINKNDALKLVKWLKDDEVTKYTNESKDMALEIERVIYRREEILLNYYLNQNCYFYMIDHKDEPVGFISLIPKKDYKVEIVIVIGEKEQWGNKLGHFALIKIMDEVKSLGGKGILAKINRENTRSIGLFEHLGFTHVNENEKYISYNIDIN